MTMPNAASDGYRAFLEAANEVEALISSRPGLTPEDVAEGYQYLAGQWQFHLDRVFKGYDVDRPCFVRDMDSHRTWGFPTPDHHYYSAQIDSSGEYRILGYRGTTSDYCFEVLSGLVGDDGVVGQRTDALEADRMHFEADGRYELFIGGAPRPRNWLRADATTRTIFVRQTVGDWRTETPTPMLIERIDRNAPAAPSTRPSPDRVGALFRQAARNLMDQVRFLDGLSRHWAQSLPLNELPPPAVGPADAGYFPGQYNTRCRFEFSEGEALLLTMKPTPCRYQSISLGHPIWFNSIDPRHTQSTFNLSESALSSDGVFRFVLCDRDPGIHNWLDTGGQRTGFVFLRYQQVLGGPPAVPVLQRLSMEALSAVFPADEPVLGIEDRRERARLRRLSIERRFF